MKNAEDYYTNPYSSDGRRSNCIDCAKRTYYRYYHENRERLIAQTDEWRRNNLERVAANRRQWYRRKPEHMRKAVDDWRARYPLKAAAHFAVMYALKGVTFSGNLARSAERPRCKHITTTTRNRLMSNGSVPNTTENRIDRRQSY